MAVIGPHTSSGSQLEESLADAVTFLRKAPLTWAAPTTPVSVSR